MPVGLIVPGYNEQVLPCKHTTSAPESLIVLLILAEQHLVFVKMLNFAPSDPDPVWVGQCLSVCLSVCSSIRRLPTYLSVYYHMYEWLWVMNDAWCTSVLNISVWFSDDASSWIPGISGQTLSKAFVKSINAMLKETYRGKVMTRRGSSVRKATGKWVPEKKALGSSGCLGLQFCLLSTGRVSHYQGSVWDSVYMRINPDFKYVPGGTATWMHVWRYIATGWKQTRH